MPPEGESEFPWENDPKVNNPEARSKGQALMRSIQIANYQANSVLNTSLREGCFGAASAKLLDISLMLEAAIEIAMRNAESALTILPQLELAFKYYLATTKQAGRHSELELKWKKLQQRIEDRDNDQMRKRRLH